jgi:hypothetical protein
VDHILLVLAVVLVLVMVVAMASMEAMHLAIQDRVVVQDQDILDLH